MVAVVVVVVVAFSHLNIDLSFPCVLLIYSFVCLHVSFVFCC